MGFPGISSLSMILCVRREQTLFNGPYLSSDTTEKCLTVLIMDRSINSEMFFSVTTGGNLN